MGLRPGFIAVVLAGAIALSIGLYVLVSSNNSQAEAARNTTKPSGLTPPTYVTPPTISPIITPPTIASVAVVSKPAVVEPVVPPTPVFVAPPPKPVVLPVVEPMPIVPEPVAVALPPTTFDEKIKPYLTKYCTGCHNSEKNAGGVALDTFMNETHAKKDRKTWETVHKVITAGEMPPKKKTQPAKPENDLVLAWVNSIIRVDCAVPKDPGRVTIRRLNRSEYNNTIRDLCGVDFKPADDFPSDDVGYGFDNIGDVLSLQPLLIEKYMSAADRILDAAITIVEPLKSTKRAFRNTEVVVVPRDARSKDEKPKILFTAEGVAYLERLNFPATGSYTIKVRAYGSSPDDTKPQLVIRVDNKDQKSFDVTGSEDKPGDFTITMNMDEGNHRVAATFANPSDTKKLEGKKPRSLGISGIEVEGPIGGAPRPLPASSKTILTTIPNADITKIVAAEKTLAEFARRAYRRPVKPEEVTRLMKLFDMGEKESFDKAIRLPLKAVLVSPHFLFRIEEDPKNPDETKQIGEFELATRLSYFLWSTMPDDELYRLAEKGELRKPGVLDEQVRRMLKSPKAVALTENFAGQWLMLRNLRSLSPDTGRFPTWDDALRNAMIRETELFFEHIVKNDRKVTELLDADYTFINERLARHYGIPNVRGSAFREVKLTDGRRGGILTMGSVLTVTSNPTRTSPVKRGKWVLENLLGIQPPPPAPDVPELPPVGQLKGTLRQQMEQHRANAACAVCHNKLDPLGFGLENFDGIGTWRDQDNKQPIDASGVLPDGGKFNGPAELRKILLGKSDEFRRCLADKLLTFALGRGLEYYDKCVLDDLTKQLKAEDDKFSALVMAIVKSDAFQKRRGKRTE